MTSPQVAKFASLIRDALPGRQNMAAATEHVRSSLAGLFEWTEELEAALAESVQLVEAEFKKIEVLKKRHSIVSKRPDWYAGKKPGDRHWPALETYLREHKRWDKDTVDSVDETSTEIVSLLDNPSCSRNCFKSHVNRTLLRAQLALLPPNRDQHEAFFGCLFNAASNLSCIHWPLLTTLSHEDTR